MIQKYKHISFDLDGTLVHTIPKYRHKIVPKVVKVLGGKILNKHSVDKFWFESNRSVIIKNEFNLDPDIFWKLFREADLPEKRSAHTKAYQDAEIILRKLKNAGKVTSIITGSPHWIAKMEIEKLNGAPYDYYLSIHDSEFDEKPDPRSLNFVLDKLKIKPQETVYIGNSNEDAYFAKNAGTDFIYLERKEHKFDLRDYSIATINNLEELFNL